jgi:hypothetical protein
MSFAGSLIIVSKYLTYSKLYDKYKIKLVYVKFFYIILRAFKSYFKLKLCLKFL